MKKLLIILITFCSLHVVSQSSNTKTVDNQYKEDIATLNERIDSIRHLVNIGNESLSHANETYITAKEIFTAKESIINWVASIFLIVGFLGAILGIKFVKREIRERFENVLKENEKSLVDIVKKHNKEQFLLDNSKILIINKRNTSIEVNFKKILNQFNNYPKIIEPEDFKGFDYNILSQFDVVILDNNRIPSDTEDNWDFNQVQLKKGLIDLVKETCQKKVAFLYFGSDDFDGRFSKSDELKDFIYLINFSNKPATLFANLIDLLDFRKLIYGKSA